jgi:hypothetical protein
LRDGRPDTEKPCSHASTIWREVDDSSFSDLRDVVGPCNYADDIDAGCGKKLREFGEDSTFATLAVFDADVKSERTARVNPCEAQVRTSR